MFRIIFKTIVKVALGLAAVFAALVLLQRWKGGDSDYIEIYNDAEEVEDLF